MITNNDFYLNQLFKNDRDIEEYPQNFFFYSNGMYTLFIKRLRSKKYALCGLGTNINPIEKEKACDIYYKFDNLLDAKKTFEATISLLMSPHVKKESDFDALGLFL